MKERGQSKACPHFNPQKEAQRAPLYQTFTQRMPLREDDIHYEIGRYELRNKQTNFVEAAEHSYA